MTNKEAISMLKSKLDGHTDTSYEWCECVRLAIKALEQSPKARTARCNGCRFYEDCKREMESEE